MDKTPDSQSDQKLSTDSLHPAQQHQFFDTEHLNSDMKGRSVRGGALTLTSQATKFVVNTGATMVLARLLTPSDYGLVAMVAPITGFVALFKDMGLTMATVQRPTINQKQISTLFWINVAISTMLMLLTMAIAPLIGKFYNEPRAVLITLAMAAMFLYGGFAAQHQALLQRQMRFGSLVAADLTALICGVIAGITAALIWKTYWALVLMMAVTGFVNLVMLWTLSKWRPGAPSRGSGVRDMLRFGGNLTGFNVVNYVTRNLDNVLIGRVWGDAALGLYSRAYSLLVLPMSQINAPITTVAMPALSRLQNQPARYRSYYQQVIAIMVTIGMPVVVFTFVAADSIVLLLLGDQWMDAVPIFRALGPAAFLGTFNVATGLVFLSLGQTGRYFKWNAMIMPGYIMAIVIGLQWGPIGVAIAFSTAMVLLRFPSIAYCYRFSPLRISDLIQAIWRPAVASIFAGFCLYAVSLIPWVASMSQLVYLAPALAGYACFYLLSMALLPGGAKILSDMRSLFSVLRGSDEQK